MKQFEASRHNISAKQFYSYCRRMAMKKGLNPENYLEYEDWENPISPCDIRNRHEDWDEPKTEICKHLKYDAQFYLQGHYNFIMEWDGEFGYCYMWENDEEDRLSWKEEEDAKKRELAFDISDYLIDYDRWNSDPDDVYSNVLEILNNRKYFSYLQEQMDEIIGYVLDDCTSLYCEQAYRGYDLIDRAKEVCNIPVEHDIYYFYNATDDSAPYSRQVTGINVMGDVRWMMMSNLYRPEYICDDDVLDYAESHGMVFDRDGNLIKEMYE